MPRHRRTTNLPGADERAVKRLSRKPMHVATDYAGRQISIHKRSKASGLVCLSRGREGRHAPSGPRPRRIRYADFREHQPSATSEQALAKDRVASHVDLGAVCERNDPANLKLSNRGTRVVNCGA